MWTPGGFELVIVLVIVLVIFGPGKLPQLGKQLGNAISEFKDGVKKKDKEEEPAVASMDSDEPAGTTVKEEGPAE